MTSSSRCRMTSSESGSHRSCESGAESPRRPIIDAPNASLARSFVSARTCRITSASVGPPLSNPRTTCLPQSSDPSSRNDPVPSCASARNRPVSATLRRSAPVRFCASASAGKRKRKRSARVRLCASENEQTKWPTPEIRSPKWSSSLGYYHCIYNCSTLIRGHCIISFSALSK